jgi:2-phospho-L-lactate guanylyltransferase
VSVWAIVPVKAFAHAKQRLSDVLAPAAREALSRAMCEHVLGVVAQCRAVDRALVVTDCCEVERAARELGAQVERDPAGATLAGVVDHGMMFARFRGAHTAVAIMSDLPRLTVADVTELIACAPGADVVVAPDESSAGTNAVRMSHPGRMPTCFGNDRSFSLHTAAATDRRLVVDAMRTPGLAFDVDDASDYARLRGGETAFREPRKASRKVVAIRRG